MSTLAQLDGQLREASLETAALLGLLCQFISRFVVLSQEQLITLALFVMETYVYQLFDCAPYLHITSAEKQCGKTKLLEVLELLVAYPWLTGRVTPAALVRKIERDHPILLLDETDAAFGGDKTYSETLRGVLNQGHRRGVKVSLCIPSGKDFQLADFDVFGPKVIAGIGKLPDTVADRSIPIHLKRKKPEESTEKFRQKLVKAETESLRARLAEWAQMQEDSMLGERTPDLPEALSDRQQDIAEPLIVIAEMAGEGWAQTAKAALVRLFGGSAAGDDSTGVRLLADIQRIFDDTGADRLSSRELVRRLTAIEGAPWEDINHGKPLNPTGLARMLRKYEIEPRNLRTGESVTKGYLRKTFEDAWARYLRPAPSHDAPGDATPLQPKPLLAQSRPAQPLQARHVADTECVEAPQ
jgi:hypothetical protein